MKDIPTIEKLLEACCAEILQHTQGLIAISATDLLRILASNVYAESTFPQIKQEAWTRIIKVLLQKYRDSNSPNAKTLQHWLDTREQE